MRRPTGFTLVELLVVVGIAAVLIALVIPLLERDRGLPRLLKDGAQLKMIHGSFLLFAEEFDGRLPIPGLVKRKPDETLGQHVPGIGAENPRWNHHAALHAHAIMNNYYSAKLTIGSTELSEKVQVMDDYDYEVYDPVAADPVYWDPRYRADVSTVSNLSFATLPLAGPRRERYWRPTMDTHIPVLGNRGPEGSADEEAQQASLRTSLACRLHGSPGEWIGQLCYGDNHTAVIRSIRPLDLTIASGGRRRPDNLFHNDLGTLDDEGTDAWLIVSYSAREAAPDGTRVDLFYEWD